MYDRTGNLSQSFGTAYHEGYLSAWQILNQINACSLLRQIQFTLNCLIRHYGLVGPLCYIKSLVALLPQTPSGLFYKLQYMSTKSLDWHCLTERPLRVRTLFQDYMQKSVTHLRKQGNTASCAGNSSAGSVRKVLTGFTCCAGDHVCIHSNKAWLINSKLREVLYIWFRQRLHCQLCRQTIF